MVDSNAMEIFSLIRNILLYEIFGVPITLAVRYVLGIKEGIMTEFSVVFVVSLGFVGSLVALQALQKICGVVAFLPQWLRLDATVTENCLPGSGSERPPLRHMACAGVVLCFSRALEYGSLGYGPVIANQSIWALMPLFYVGASMLWKDFDYEYNKITIGLLASIFVGASLVSVENPDVSAPAVMYGIGWIMCKSQLIVYLDYIRMKLGTHPNVMYMYTNAVAGVCSLLMYWILGDDRIESISLETVLLGAVLFGFSMLYGMYFLIYDSPALRVGESQSIPYRSTIRIGIAVLVASIIFRPGSEVYNYVGFAIVFIAANLHKFVQIRLEEHGERLIDDDDDEESRIIVDGKNEDDGTDQCDPLGGEDIG